jgi:phosphatidylglycerol:prolipoprotein diacylglycerol transferase
MLPVLVDLGFIKIHTIGVFFVLGFFWTAYFIWKNVQLTSFKEEQVFDGVFISLGVGFVIGRIIYIAFHFSDFGFDILKYIIVMYYPGVSLWGAILGFLLTLYIFTVVQKVKFSDLIDYLVPALFLALAIGKIGSFFSGIEVGARTDFPLSVKYANADGMRHLTAFYESLLFFVGSFLTYQLMFQVRKGVLSKGFLLPFFLWFFSIVYAGMDFLKEGQVVLYGYSVYQILAMFFILTISIYFIYYFRQFLFSKLFPK